MFKSNIKNRILNHTLGTIISTALFGVPFVHAQRANNTVGIVDRVIDGDTISVKINNQKEKIRLSCVDAPEKGQVGGVEATKFLSGLTPIGSEVLIVKTDGNRDRFGRLLGVVFNGKTFVNLAMVANGHAIVYQQYLSKCPNSRQDLVKAEANAKSKKLNLWNNPNFCSPQNFRQKKC
jgi:micrococcal nuclease